MSRRSVFEKLLPVNCENVEVTQTFTYLGSVIHSSTGCGPEVNRRLERVLSAMDSLDEGVGRSPHLSKMTKVRVFRALCLLYSCETWALTSALKRRLTIELLQYYVN